MSLENEIKKLREVIELTNSLIKDFKEFKVDEVKTEEVETENDEVKTEEVETENETETETEDNSITVEAVIELAKEKIIKKGISRDKLKKALTEIKDVDGISDLNQEELELYYNKIKTIK